MDHSHLTLLSAASVPAAECPENLFSALVAQVPLGSVDPSTSTSTPDSHCWSTLEPAIVGAVTLPVQPNPFGAHPFQALRDIVRDSFPLPTVALERPQHLQSKLKPEQSREHALVPTQNEVVARVRPCLPAAGVPAGDRACFSSAAGVTSVLA